MTTLTITITQVIEPDYDGVNETTKHVTGSIDGVTLNEVTVCQDTDTDADCKTEFKDDLTSKGYVWDAEA